MKMTKTWLRTEVPKGNVGMTDQVSSPLKQAARALHEAEVAMGQCWMRTWEGLSEPTRDEYYKAARAVLEQVSAWLVRETWTGVNGEFRYAFSLDSADGEQT